MRTTSYRTVLTTVISGDVRFIKYHIGNSTRYELTKYTDGNNIYTESPIGKYSTTTKPSSLYYDTSYTTSRTFLQCLIVSNVLSSCVYVHGDYIVTCDDIPSTILFCGIKCVVSDYIQFEPLNHGKLLSSYYNPFIRKNIKLTYVKRLNTILGDSHKCICCVTAFGGLEYVDGVWRKQTSVIHGYKSKVPLDRSQFIDNIVDPTFKPTAYLFEDDDSIKIVYTLFIGDQETAERLQREVKGSQVIQRIGKYVLRLVLDASTKVRRSRT